MTRFNRVFIASALCALAVLASLRVPISGDGTPNFYCAIGQTTCIVNTANCDEGDVCDPNDTTTTFSTCYAMNNVTCTEIDVWWCDGKCRISKDDCTYTRNICAYND